LSQPVVRTGNLQFYRARAAEAGSAADAATLPHVRDRCLRSEAAWTALAGQAERSQRLRDEDQLRKAAPTSAVIDQDEEMPHGNG
jgi:hypothetical protein